MVCAKCVCSCCLTPPRPPVLLQAISHPHEQIPVFLFFVFIFQDTDNGMAEFARTARLQGDDSSGEGAMAEGLATAFQCFQDGMGEKLVSLAKEQSALLSKLEASREVKGHP